MGLLDDAIREHLELKRLRGADPSEVARDERAALGPPGDEDGEDYDVEEPDFAESDGESDDYEEEPSAVEGDDWMADGPAEGDLPHSSEETMEVDMRTIIDADLTREDADREINEDAMAANAAVSDSGAGLARGGWEVAPSSADRAARKRRRWAATRPVRALRLGGGPSVEGSLP
jgi:hypothetical protein